MRSKSGHGRVFGAVLSEGLSVASGRAAVDLPTPSVFGDAVTSPSNPAVAAAALPGSSPLFPRRSGVDQADPDDEVPETTSELPPATTLPASIEEAPAAGLGEPSAAEGSCVVEEPPPLNGQQPSGAAAGGGDSEGDAAFRRRRRGSGGAEDEMGCGGVAMTKAFLVVVVVVAVAVAAVARRVAEAMAAMRPLKSIKVSCQAEPIGVGH